jgi:hypothetical protein
MRVAPVLVRGGDLAAYLASGTGDADSLAPLRDAERTRRPPGNADFSAGLERRPGRPVAKPAPGRKPKVQRLTKLFGAFREIWFVSRNSNLMESATDFVAVEMPHASRLVLHVMAAFAGHEREMISQRTRAALAAAKARGVRLGLNGARIAARHHREAVAYAATIEAHVRAARASGAKTLTAIAAYLNAYGVPSREGKLWHPSSVSRTVRRLDDAAKEEAAKA